MKWVLLGNKYVKERYDYLNQWINENIEESQVEFLSCEKEELEEKIKELQLQFDQIRIERPHRENMLSVLHQQTSMNLTLKAADVLLKLQEKWWPRSTIYEGISRLVTKKFSHIDLSQAILVVGTGASSRAAIGAFIRLGFTEINLTDRSREKGLQTLEELKKSYFGVDFRFTNLDELTLLPGNHQIVFNTTPNIEENPILKELYFFNYLQYGGLVIDVALQTSLPQLLVEASSINAQIIDGCELAAWSDVVWIEMCFGKRVEQESYLEGLRNKLAP